jgi:raffinose/stachyose/melibiose transport system permease protein
MLNRLNLTLTKVLIFATLVVLSVSNLYPLLYMLLNSLKTRATYLTNPFNLPDLRHAAWNNYVTMISQFQIFSLFRNTLIISVCTVTLLLIFGIVASYAFAKLEFSGKNIIYFVIISSMFVPVQVTIIPIYLLLSKVHLVNTYWAVIVTYLGMFLAETILLLTSAFRGIPDEMMEAAELDGAGYFDTLRYIIVPMGRPAIVLCLIYYFIVTWNDLFTPLILLTDMDRRTVMVALASLMSRYSGDPTLQFAGLVLAAIPAILVYAIFQNYIIKGIGEGSTR